MTESPLVDLGFVVPVFFPGDDLIAFLNKDFDTYDSDCDDISNAKAVFMANISNYGSDVISEVPHFKTNLNDMENQSVHAMQDFEQLPAEKANKEQNSESVTAELERYKERVKTFEQCLNFDLSCREKMIDSQMDDMIKEKLPLKEQVDSLEQNLSKQIKEKECLLQTFTVFKMGHSAQTMHMLTKPQAFYDNIHKQALGYQNSFHLKKAQRIKPTLYDGIVISNKHFAMSVIDDEETLILEEKSRSKMSENQKDPEQELDDEQAFWFRISNPTIESSNRPPVKVEVPSELPKVSLVNSSLKKLKFHLAQFDSVVKKRTTPDARTEEFFENNDLKAQLQDKDSTICKLMDIIKSIRGKSKEENFKFLKSSLTQSKKTYVRTKEQSDSLIDKLNLKSAENEDLKTQIQDKVFVITSLKNDLRKLKGKEIVDIAAQIPFANTIVQGMFKLDLEPLAPRLLQNREAHIDYLKYTQDQANSLWEIVEQAKAKQPLDKELDFTCKHAQRIHELLVYVRDTCPNAISLSAKGLLSHPKTRSRKLGLVNLLHPQATLNM
ncbi:hypothetical protein Tco_1042753 [Tanacetum coccineum]|uniref:Uncharacterized protein n=1 Tax=Tanacetum coccineum TaxID=301880 RepID=A0ABQ5GMM6_9ASTR